MWALYRVTDTVANILFDTIGGTVLATVFSLTFNSYVNWALFFIVVFIAVSDSSALTSDDVLTPLIVTASATAFALIWHAMYFRYAGPLPPTVKESGRRMAIVTLASFLTIHLSSPERGLSRSGTLTAGAFVLGLIGAALTGLSPLPELLILAGVLWTVGTTSSSSTQSPRYISAVDVEDRFISGVADTVRNEKGRYSLLLIASGIVASLVFVAAFVGMFRIDYASGRPPMGWGNFLIGAALFSSYSAYGVWYWLRILRRTPAFLSSGEIVSSNTGVTRPIGLFVPPAIFCGGLTGVASGAPILGLAGLALGFVAMLWSVVATEQASPQRAKTDQYAIPVSLVVQLVPLLALGFPNTAIPMIVLPLVYFVPEVRRRVGAPAALGLAVGLLAVFTALLWPLTINRMLSMLVLPAEIALGTALLESLSRSGV